MSIETHITQITKDFLDYPIDKVVIKAMCADWWTACSSQNGNIFVHQIQNFGS